MTSEEAIEIIIEGENAPIQQAADAQEMAIEALKSQAKYEEALELACDKISCMYCVLHDVHPCEETHHSCVKRKADHERLYDMIDPIKDWNLRDVKFAHFKVSTEKAKG